MKFKVIAALCVPAFFLSSCTSGTQVAVESDMLRYELHGDVASVRSVPYKVDSVQGGYTASEIDPMANNIYAEFNRDGMITLLQRFNREDKPVSVQKSVYDNRGMLRESVLEKNSGEVLEKTVYEYRSGRIAAMTVRDGMDSLKKYEKYDYSDKDSVRVDYSLKEGKPSGHRMLAYDSDGRNTANVIYNVKGMKMSEFRLTYDSLGRRKSIYSDNLFFGKMNSVMTYDDSGMCSELVMEGENNRMVLTFEYVLDGKGNWTEKRTFRNGSAIPVKIEKREIHYR